MFNKMHFFRQQYLCAIRGLRSTYLSIITIATTIVAIASSLTSTSLIAILNLLNFCYLFLLSFNRIRFFFDFFWKYTFMRIVYTYRNGIVFYSGIYFLLKSKTHLQYKSSHILGFVPRRESALKFIPLSIYAPIFSQINKFSLCDIWLKFSI